MWPQGLYQAHVELAGDEQAPARSRASLVKNPFPCSREDGRRSTDSRVDPNDASRSSSRPPVSATTRPIRLPVYRATWTATSSDFPRPTSPAPTPSRPAFETAAASRTARDQRSSTATSTYTLPPRRADDASRSMRRRTPAEHDQGGSRHLRPGPVDVQAADAQLRRPVRLLQRLRPAAARRRQAVRAGARLRRRCTTCPNWTDLNPRLGAILRSVRQRQDRAQGVPGPLCGQDRHRHRLGQQPDRHLGEQSIQLASWPGPRNGELHPGLRADQFRRQRRMRRDRQRQFRQDSTPMPTVCGRHDSRLRQAATTLGLSARSAARDPAAGVGDGRLLPELEQQYPSSRGDFSAVADRQPGGDTGRLQSVLHHRAGGRAVAGRRRLPGVRPVRRAARPSSA